jgi:hypothetical protein
MFSFVHECFVLLLCIRKCVRVRPYFSCVQVTPTKTLVALLSNRRYVCIRAFVCACTFILHFDEAVASLNTSLMHKHTLLSNCSACYAQLHRFAEARSLLTLLYSFALFLRHSRFITYFFIAALHFMHSRAAVPATRNCVASLKRWLTATRVWLQTLLGRRDTTDAVGGAILLL